MFVDSHCHLSHDGLIENIQHVQAAMAQAQVDRALCICTTLEEFPDVHGLAQAWPNLWATVGVHPDNEGVQEPSLEDLLSRAALPRVVAIGETGLDYYRLNGRSTADMAWQRERFRVHIRASVQSGLPLVVHTRSASADTLAILAEEGAGHLNDGGVGVGVGAGAASGLRGVFHCFTESAAVAEAALAMGFYISFSGILSFRNAQELRDVASWVPLDRCLIETDSPYLAPMPFRGKPNTPAYVPYVAAALAAAKGLDVAEVAAQTTLNFDRLFAPKP